MGADEGLPAGKVASLVQRLLEGLDTLSFIGRHLHPPHLPALLEAAEGAETALREALAAFRAAPRPEHLRTPGACLEEAGEAALQAFAGLREAVLADDLRQAYRAMRQTVRAQEALYPVAASLPSVSRFFLELDSRDDSGLLDRLAASDPDRADAGVMHAGGAKGSRGGYSLYVPEYYRPDVSYPLVMALHGGSGNGGAFLWTWLAAARSRGMILVSPTASGDTWSLMEPEIDGENLGRILAELRGRWNIDPSHMLLTGMSDGGTFTLASGLGAASPFTHLAPIAASFHPLLLAMGDMDRLRGGPNGGLPVYLVHGALDWMFPVSRSRDAEEALTAYGARVTYREIADLSHTYPREENARILDWLLATPAG